MSAKDEFSNNKAKEFFILHGEKLAFGVCLLLVAVFFLLGRGVESLEPNKAPSVLSSKVAAANQHMNRLDKSTWENEIEDARKPNFDLEEFVIEGRKLIEYTPYYSYLYLPAREPQALRKDPDLLPPSKPVLVAINAALVVPGSRESPLDMLEIAQIEKEEDKGRRRKTGRREGADRFTGGPGAGFSPYGDETYSDSGADDQPMALAVEDGGEPQYREVTPSILKRLPGFKLASGTSGVPEAYTMVAGTATVPIKEQWLEYKRKFENSIGFDPMRDRPLYTWYEVQRQDVTDRPGGAVDPDGWGDPIMWTKSYDDWYREKRYAPPPPIVDLAYYEGSTGRLHDYALTSPIPIILLRDIDDFALHPDTPKRKSIAQEETPEDAEEDPMEAPRIGPDSVGPVAGPTPMDLDADSETDTYMGVGDGGYEGGTTEFVDFDPETGPAAPLKLVRFFDLTAKPGRKYRYRLRVALVDPNNPLPRDQATMGPTGEGQGGDEGMGNTASAQSDLSDELSLRWLDKDARDRVEKIRQDDEAQYGRDERGKPIRFNEWRKTDWSQPSDVVIVSQRGEQILAGSVTPPKERRIDENVSFATEEPTGKLVVSEWVPKFAVDVPAEKKVSLGSILNFTNNADVLHPIQLLIKRIPKYQFKTDAIVLDMRGGQRLPGGDDENPLPAPGEILVIDTDGQLHARNELDDMDELRMKLLLPDEEELEPEDTGLYGGDVEAGGDDIYDSFSPRSTRGSRRGS